MQAGFILGLFGSLFFVIASMTTMMVESTQQTILRQTAQTREILADFERTLNGVVLKQLPSIVNDVPIGTGYEVTGGMAGVLESANVGSRWNIEQLTRDPWGVPYNVSAFTRDYADSEPPVAAFGPSRHATPVVHYFTLTSPGRDRAYETGIGSNPVATGPRPTNHWEWTALRTDGAKGDDIVHTFSTRDAMLAIWNRIDDVHTRMSAQLRSDYVRSVDNFLKRNDVKTLFDALYSCVARGVTTGCSAYFPGIEGGQHIQNCINANTAGEVDWPALAGGQLPAGWPPLPAGYPAVRPDWWPKMTTANCWMAIPAFQNITEGGVPIFPSMVEQAIRTSDQPGQCTAAPCSFSGAQLETLGLGALRSRDPLGGEGLEFHYTKELPTLLLMRRSTTIQASGWEIEMDVIIDGEKAGM